MPSTRSLAARLAVSRMTIVNAYEMLFAEGYIEGRSGSGTYVSSVLPEEMLEIKDKKTSETKAPASNWPRFSRRGRLLAAFGHTHLRASRTDRKFSAFHPGIPAMDAFPFDVWSRLVSRRLKGMSVSLFGSGNPMVFPKIWLTPSPPPAPCRTAIRRQLTKPF